MPFSKCENVYGLPPQNGENSEIFSNLLKVGIFALQKWEVYT